MVHGVFHRALSSIYAKITFGAVLAMVGVAVGIRLGYVLTGEAAPVGPATYTNGADRNEVAREAGSLVSLEPGDRFPPESFLAADGSAGRFDTVLTGQATILLFVHFDCDRCLEMLKEWREDIRSRLRPNVRTIVCVGQQPKEFTNADRRRVGNLPVVFIERDHWRQQYNLRVWPTLIGVDEQGFVTTIQVGYPGAFDHQFLVDFGRD